MSSMCESCFVIRALLLLQQCKMVGLNFTSASRTVFVFCLRSSGILNNGWQITSTEGQMIESAFTFEGQTRAVGQESATRPAMRCRKKAVKSLAVSLSTSRTGLTWFLTFGVASVSLGIKETPVNIFDGNCLGPNLLRDILMKRQARCHEKTSV